MDPEFDEYLFDFHDFVPDEGGQDHVDDLDADEDNINGIC